MCFKFVEHYMWIATSMIHAGDDVGMWDEEDGFFYDVLRLPHAPATRLKVRSMVGLLPFCAVTVFEGEFLKKFPEAIPRLRQFIDARPELRTIVHDPGKRGEHGRMLASILDERRLALALPRGPPVRVPRQGRGLPCVVPARGIRQRHVWRQFQLAGPDLDAGQRVDHSRPSAVLRLLRRRVHRRVPHRLRPPHDALRGRP
jgi:hypothetical protein